MEEVTCRHRPEGEAGVCPVGRFVKGLSEWRQRPMPRPGGMRDDGVLGALQGVQCFGGVGGGGRDVQRMRLGRNL